MSARDPGATATRLLALVLLRLYPPKARPELRRLMIDGAQQRLERERRERGGLRAVARTWWLLVADTLRYAPREWPGARGGRHGGGGPRPRTLWMDARHALRRMRRRPWATGLTVAVLTLTVGANAAILGIADAVLLRGLPYPEPERLHAIGMWSPSTQRRYAMVPDVYLNAIERGVDGVEGVAILHPFQPSVVVDTPVGPAALSVVSVSRDYFGVLGTRPHLGRFFDGGDVPGRETAVLSHATWMTWLGGDADALGTRVTLGDTSIDVIGVLPPGFIFPTKSAGTPDVVMLAEPMSPPFEGGTFYPLVRLARGVSPVQAQAQVDAAAEAVAGSAPEVTSGTTPVLEGVRAVLYEGAPPILALLLVASGSVLLVGCANLAGLLLVRVKRDQTGLAVRSALGASRARLVVPLLLEAAFVAVLASALAVGLAAVTFDTLLRSVPTIAYGNAPVGIDARVAAITFAIGIAAGLACVAAPAWRMSGAEVGGLIRQATAGRPRGAWLGSGMISVQVAAAVVLVFGALVATRSLVELVSAPVGFDTEAVAVIDARPSDCAGLECQDRYLRWVDALTGRGDVALASAAGSLPLVRPVPWAGIEPEGTASKVAEVVQALTGYFDVTGISLLRGREYTREDALADAPVAVLSESAAAVLVRDRDPLGAVIEDHDQRTRTVVGVVSDARYILEGDVPAKVYVPPGAETRFLTLVVKTRRTDPQMLVELRETMLAVTPDVVLRVRWWADTIAAMTPFRTARFHTVVLTGFGLLALLLMGLGVYGVIAYRVSSRTREVGIRMALGGTAHAVVRLVVGESVAAVALGLVVGLPMTLLPSKLASMQFVGFQSGGSLGLASACLTVLAATVAAAWIPARRATRIDPVEAQRVV